MAQTGGGFMDIRPPPALVICGPKTAIVSPNSGIWSTGSGGIPSLDAEGPLAAGRGRHLHTRLVTDVGAPLSVRPEFGGSAATAKSSPLSPGVEALTHRP